MTRRRRTALAWASLIVTVGCTGGTQLRGRIAGLEKIATDAEANGARQCAPRELALAQSHLKFARIELEQGSLSDAEEHVWLAEPNARAAYALSPPDRCAIGDRDGDGYPDNLDKCPDDPENFNGYQDEDGCPDDPDTDGDGIPDSEDSCVLEPEDKDSYLDADGCPDIDNDLDGILDVQDQCPNDPEDPDGYQDEDGCPDPDNDGDTVPDLKDQCPNVIGSTDEEPLGCPKKPPLVMISDCEVKITQQIHFEYDKAIVRPDSYAILDAVAEMLQKNPDIKIEVQGHTDNRGSAEYNRPLSDRRAGAVVKYLTARGVEAARLTSRGYGLSRPIVPNDSPQNMALNRRVQFVRTEGTKAGCPAQEGPESPPSSQDQP